MRPALEPSRWARAAASFDQRMGQGRDFASLVEPSMDALDTFFHERKPVPDDKVLRVVVHDGKLVIDLVTTAEAPALPLLPGRVPGLSVQAPTDAGLLPLETEGLLELPSEISELAVLVSYVATVLEAGAPELVATFRSLFGLRYSPQALVRIARGGGRVTLPTRSQLVEAYRDPEEDEPNPMVVKRVVSSGLKILLGLFLGFLFCSVIR
ncbi:MAG: hypothetical protein ACYTDU_15970 [Planctomycetota bacterium]